MGAQSVNAEFEFIIILENFFVIFCLGDFFFFFVSPFKAFLPYLLTDSSVVADLFGNNIPRAAKDVFNGHELIIKEWAGKLFGG